MLTSGITLAKLNQQHFSQTYNNVLTHFTNLVFCPQIQIPTFKLTDLAGRRIDANELLALWQDRYIYYTPRGGDGWRISDKRDLSGETDLSYYHSKSFIPFLSKRANT